MTAESEKFTVTRRIYLSPHSHWIQKKMPLYQLNSYISSISINLLFLKDKFTVTTLPSYQDSTVTHY